MTEPFPFGEQDQAPVAYEDEAKDNRRTVVAVGALAAVVVGAGAFLFLGGSGAEEVEEFVAPVRAPRAAAAASPAPLPKIPATSNIALGRNPFKALYVEPPAAPAEPAEQTPTTTTPTGDGTQIIVVGGSGASTGGSTGGGGSSTGGSGTGATTTRPGTDTPAQPAPARLYKLVLTSVYGEDEERTAVFSIDGKEQTAKVGAVFGPTAQLLLISLQEGPKPGEWTAVLQVGDGDPFDTVTGEAKYVP